MYDPNEELAKQAATAREQEESSAKNWIDKAVKPKNKGIFGKKAKKAGMSTSKYAAKVTKKGSKADAKTKRQGNLAKTFAKMRGKKK